MAPELEDKPSSISTLLGLAGTAIGGWQDFKATGKPNMFNKNKSKKTTTDTSLNNYGY